MRAGRIFITTALAALAAALFLHGAARAAESVSDEGAAPPPPTREHLENLPKMNTFTDEDPGLPFDIRGEAMREAALSYGARGGLSWRTWHIQQELGGRASYMDRVFDFRQLLIAAPSGLLIEPPVVSEAENAMLINASGTEAAVADRTYDISVDARIVGTARSWRNYVERDWGEVTPPPDILRPNDEYEREKWIAWVREGWERGVDQADEIFQDDLNELMADYQGMVRYRMLLAQGIITPPYALQIDRGITGGGRNLRVGDRAVQITGMPEFVPGAETWQPANR